jgi:hypothetical protein
LITTSGSTKDFVLALRVTSSKLRAESLIKYLGCIDDAQRIEAVIEALTAPFDLRMVPLRKNRSCGDATIAV